jgi:hypothetical protein
MYEDAYITGTDILEARLVYQSAPFAQIMYINIASTSSGEVDKLSFALALSTLLSQVLTEINL